MPAPRGTIRRHPRSVAVLTVAVAVLATGCTRDGSPSPQPTDRVTVGAPVALTVAGKPVTAVSSALFQGKHVALRDPSGISVFAVDRGEHLWRLAPPPREGKGGDPTAKGTIGAARVWSS